MRERGRGKREREREGRREGIKLMYYTLILSLQAFADVLRTNTSLLVLNLESNRITRKGIRVSLYFHVLYLYIMTLEFNPIGNDEGVGGKSQYFPKGVTTG